MPKQATFRYGHNIQTKDYTPVGALDAGEVVPLVTGVGITTIDIAAGEVGALNISGGVYSVQTTAVYAADTDVWWDNVTKKVTTTSAGNKYFGKTLTATTVNGYHDVAHFQPTPAA